MKDIIFQVLAFIIAAVAFGFGAFKLFRKGKPLYMQILVCAAGCLAVMQLSFMVNLWCDIQESVSINLLGIFGCNLFLLSANYGTLDKIVDDGTSGKKAKTIAAFMSVVALGLAITPFFTWWPYDMFFAVSIVVMLLPIVPASYFNVKHILLPMDMLGLLKVTKPCNIVALVFYFFSIILSALSVFNNLMFDGILSALMSVSMLVLIVFAVRGAEKWGI